MLQPSAPHLVEPHPKVNPSAAPRRWRGPGSDHQLGPGLRLALRPPPPLRALLHLWPCPGPGPPGPLAPPLPRLASVTSRARARGGSGRAPGGGDGPARAPRGTGGLLRRRPERSFIASLHDRQRQRLR
ncbi:translation initiation factor IF-2-like [Camelus ferus]|uniref:Translation initiation factor IF-2-like n=1 Tax=Camelus ferus TaxID=419612 RepID=A0A8B8S8A2_CAMFR|nr:translation initiation factor IF-2-like [Camelus ferus]